MATQWTILLAVFAPVALGLLTLLLPRPWIERRLLLAVLGLAIAFALLLNVTLDSQDELAALAPQSHDADAAHVEADADTHHPPSDNTEAHGSHGDADAHPQEAAADVHANQHGHGDSHAVDAAWLDVASPGEGIAWMPSLHINFAFLTDGLGLFFALLVSGIGMLIVLYARGYFGRAGPTSADDCYRFFPTLGFFTTAMLGVVLADYTILTLLFWEMTSISSFLLIGWDRYDKKAVKLAMQAFFTTGLGGMGLFGGVLVFGNATGGIVEGGIWRWSQMMAHAGEVVDLITSGSPAMLWAFVLMFIGAGTKSAQFPFHYWLPGAMAAPTPVSAFLHSATMVKAGVFLVGRLFPVFAVLPLFPKLIIPLGAVTMLYGGIIALQQHDLKRIFAFTTVSQLGLLMAMYGLGAIDFTTGGHTYAAIDFDITQIANHAFYKAPLFITAGAIGHVLSRDITKLNGAFYKHPAICGTMMLAAFGLAAFPGTISFQAKELFLYGIVNAAGVHPVLYIVLGMTVLMAVCNVAICVRICTTLLGLPGGMTEADGEPDPHGHHEHVHETGLLAHLIWLPALVIVSLQFVGGFFPKLVWAKVFGALEHVNGHNYIAHHYHGIPNLGDVAGSLAHPGLPLICSMIAIVLGVIVGMAKPLRGSVADFADKIYPAMYWLSVTGGGRCFRVIQTGNLKHYLAFILIALLIGFGWAVAIDPGMLTEDALRDAIGQTFEYWPGVLMGLIVCITAVLIPMTHSRIVRVLFLGACGFTVVALYLVYQAPDLALTQLMFEIISVILFVIVLRLLPKELGKRDGGKLWRGGLACMVGLLFGWMTLIAATTDRGETNPHARPLGHTLAQHSYGNEATDEYGHPIPLQETALNDGARQEKRGGGGNNMVNVILVDFRGFDTMGEVAVLGLAAMGVWSMLPHRRRRDGATHKNGVAA